MSKILIIKRQSIFKNDYEIHDGEVSVASLKTKGIFTKKALATIDGQEWFFYAKNLLKRNIEATSQGGPTLTFSADTLRASGATQINSEQYFYKMIVDETPSRKRIKPMVYVWFNAKQDKIVTLRFKGLMRRAGMAVISDTKLPSNNYLLLILLALFRLNIENRNNVG